MPSLYSYYDPQKAVADAEARRQEMVAKLQELGNQRQQFTNRMYGDETARMDAERAAGEHRQANLNRTSLDETAKGAAMGSMGGPWGALIGGAAGSGIGAVKAYGQRRKEGQGALEAGAKSIGDFLTGGIFSAGDQAAHGDYDSIEAGLPLVGVGAGMAGKAFSDYMAGPQPAGGNMSNADFAKEGNAQADMERVANSTAGQAGSAESNSRIQRLAQGVVDQRTAGAGSGLRADLLEQAQRRGRTA